MMAKTHIFIIKLWMRWWIYDKCIHFLSNKSMYGISELILFGLFYYWISSLKTMISLHRPTNCILGPSAPLHLETLSEGQSSRNVTLTWKYPDRLRSKPFNGDFTVFWCRKKSNQVCQVGKSTRSCKTELILSL